MAHLPSSPKNGGKRHRPLICMLACKAVGGDPEKAKAAGAAIEHFHTAALIHDDIADESTLRRGEPCLHLTEGVGLARSTWATSPSRWSRVPSWATAT